MDQNQPKFNFDATLETYGERVSQKDWDAIMKQGRNEVDGENNGENDDAQHDALNQPLLDSASNSAENSDSGCCGLPFLGKFKIYINRFLSLFSF